MESAQAKDLDKLQALPGLGNDYSAIFQQFERQIPAKSMEADDE